MAIQDVVNLFFTNQVIDGYEEIQVTKTRKESKKVYEDVKKSRQAMQYDGTKTGQLIFWGGLALLFAIAISNAQKKDGK